MESISGSTVPLKSKVCRSDKVGSSELKVMWVLFIWLFLCQSTTAAVKEVLCHISSQPSHIPHIKGVQCCISGPACPWEGRSTLVKLFGGKILGILSSQIWSNLYTPHSACMSGVQVCLHCAWHGWVMIIKVCNMTWVGNIMIWQSSSIRTPGDELAKNFRGKTRVRSIHRVGMVGKVQWRDLGGHPYSGIFKGAKHGLAR